MRAGDRRERVTIQSATATRDDFGAEVLSWKDGSTVWAQVKPRTGREPMLADRPVMLIGYEVRVLAGVTVTHQDRLVWRNKVLAIDGVTPLPGEGLIVLACTESEA